MKPGIIIAVLVSFIVAGCFGAGQPPPPSKLRQVPEDWLADAKPLPNMPQCDHHLMSAGDEKRRIEAWLTCRLTYDEHVRRAYVELAGDKAALASAYRIVTKPQTSQ